MIRRSYPRRVSVKRLKANGGKMPFSTITSKPKSIRQVNPEAKARRDKRYRKHLASAYWKNLRREMWVTTLDPICEQCGERVESYADYQLGHLTYARFGHEHPDDVAIQHKWCNAREAALRGRRIRRTA